MRYQVEAEWNEVIPKLAQIHIEDGAISPPSEPTDLLTGSSPSVGGVGSVIHEDYIPSNGADLSNNLAGISLEDHFGLGPDHPDVTI